MVSWSQVGFLVSFDVGFMSAFVRLHSCLSGGLD